MRPTPTSSSGKGKSILEVRDLSVTYTDEKGSLQAIEKISFSVAPEQFICIVGPSGSGKSTLLKILAGLLEPTEGKVVLNGRELDGPRQGVGVVFQKTNLMPWRTVTKNITLPLEVEGVPFPEARDRAQDLIDLVGLTGFEDWLPQDLSGGMVQRVSIARSLIHQPKVMLLDEPFGALDALTREKMASELLRIWQARKKTVMMVTHDIPEAVYLADRVLAFSPQPGNLRLDLAVGLDRPRREEDRYTRQFVDYTQALREAIR